MEFLTPLHFIQKDFRCMCGGEVFRKHINHNYDQWVCGSCNETAIVDICEYPGYFVERKELQK